MAADIVRTPRARLDLIEIWQFIAADNEAAADGFLDRIEAALQMLSENPRAGRARPELHPDLRSFPTGKHILFYRLLPDSIELVRALSSYRDIGPEIIE